MKKKLELLSRECEHHTESVVVNLCHWCLCKWFDSIWFANWLKPVGAFHCFTTTIVIYHHADSYLRRKVGMSSQWSRAQQYSMLTIESRVVKNSLLLTHYAACSRWSSEYHPDGGTHPGRCRATGCCGSLLAYQETKMQERWQGWVLNLN